MLKYSSNKLKLAILKLFNLKSGIYPTIWNKWITSPIFKSGDNLNPNNYRGICVNSNLWKLFCSILNSRILSYLTDSNVLSKSQIGFVPKHRTIDHIFTLHTLIQKHVHQKNKGKIYACFVDFRKAFDSIWHNGLFYQLLRNSIWGKVYYYLLFTRP